MNGSKTAKSLCIKPATIYHITTYLLSFLSSLHVFNSVNVYSATVTPNSYFVGSADRWMSRAKYIHIIQSYSVVLFTWCGATYEPEKQHWCKYICSGWWWVPVSHRSVPVECSLEKGRQVAQLQNCSTVVQGSSGVATYITCNLCPKTAYIAFILCKLHWWYFLSIS